MSEGRVARFRIKARVGGQAEATVEVVEDAGGGDFTVSVRPLHSRQEFREKLSVVAQIVEARHAKWLAAQAGTPVPKPRR